MCVAQERGKLEKSATASVPPHLFTYIASRVDAMGVMDAERLAIHSADAAILGVLEQIPTPLRKVSDLALKKGLERVALAADPERSMSPWVRLDDHLDDDPRIATVGPSGAGLLVLLLVYSNKTLSDGWVSNAIVRQKATGLTDADAVIALMIRVGLLRQTERDGIDGYAIAVDLVQLQPSRAEVQAAKDGAKARKAKWLANRKVAGFIGTARERKRNARGTG
jgi:hypothetical protein